jgi:hypothetical protein
MTMLETLPIRVTELMRSAGVAEYATTSAAGVRASAWPLRIIEHSSLRAFSRRGDSRWRRGVFGMPARQVEK